jgi:3-phenylpropionate/trans-cinnamate dioxygenase ferredoxin subunit
MSEWVTVCAEGDVIEGELLLTTPNEDGVVLTRYDGRIYAISDTCTHEWCQLSEGRLDDEQLVCSCHGSVFDVTSGEVLLPPATEPLPTYEVRVDGDQVQVLLQD